MKKFKDVFKLSELVCPHVLKKYPEKQAWSFLDPRALETLAVIRTEILGVPLTINTSDGRFTQRGLRCNCCQLVKAQTNKNNPYLSAHVLGKGFDFDAKGMTAEQARQKIIAAKDKLPYSIRLEKDVTWVHFDLANYSDEKVQLFGV